MEVKDSNFEEIIKSKKVVVVDFWAPWCGPCKMMSPTIDALATEYQDKDVAFVKYNIDEESEYVMDCGIRSVPTLVYFKNGIKTDKRMSGTQKADDIKSVVEELLND